MTRNTSDQTLEHATAIEIMHVQLRKAGLPLPAALDLERQLFQKDLVDVMLLGHVPSIAIDPGDDDPTLWTAYGRLIKREFPNVSKA